MIILCSASFAKYRGYTATDELLALCHVEQAHEILNVVDDEQR